MLREMEILAAQERYRALGKAANAAVWRAAPDGTPLERCRWSQDTGQPQSNHQSGPDSWLDNLHPDDRAKVAPLWHKALATGELFEAVYRLKTADGGFRWMLGRGVPVKDETGSVREWVGTVVDVHEQRRTIENLTKSEERLTLALETADLAIWDLDLASGRTWWSEGRKRLLGIADDATLRDEGFFSLVHPEDRKWLAELRDKVFEPAHGGKLDAEFRLHRADSGDERWMSVCAQIFKDAAGKPFRVLGTLQDITRQRQQQELLFHLAYYDQLTELPNRLLLAERADAVIQSGYPATLIMIDRDGFQSFNDAAGPGAGDELLRTVAERLTATAGERAVVARVGSDEFAILLPTTGEPDIASRLAEKIHAAFAEPFKVASRTVFVGASMGVAIAPLHGASAGELMARSHLALGQAQKEGGNLYRFFTRSMHEALEAVQALEIELRRAHGGNEFELYYQPQLRLADRKVTGVEALLRWAHPDRGILAPAHFLPVLERSALAQPIGEWVITTACTTAAELVRLGFPLRMAVNLFQAQINANLPLVIERALLMSGLAPALLEIELTENIVFGSDKAMVKALHRLRDLGVGIAFDDYGTGHASLSMLKHLPVTRLKIDQSFVQNLRTSRGDAAIVEAILSLGQNFQVAVTAEGIASTEHEEALIARGCEEGQGFLYSEPRPLQDLIAWLQLAPMARVLSRA